MGGRVGGRAERVRGGQLEGGQSPERRVGARDPEHAGRRRIWKIKREPEFVISILYNCNSFQLKNEFDL